MPRAALPRVNLWWTVWAISLLADVPKGLSHSCYEVKTAFQVRQVGPLKWVPETPATDVDLLVCKHRGPSCCTRKMEESYQVAVRRETMQNIRSYSFELKYLLSAHSAAFQDSFQSLMTFSLSHVSNLLESTYSSISLDASPLLTQLFSQLSLYLQGGNVSIEATVHHFYDNLFPLVYHRLINPGSSTTTPTVASATDDRTDCLRMTRQDVNPFGGHPRATAQELAASLQAGRVLGWALALGVEVLNVSEGIPFSRDCSRALVKMQYCSHCHGLTLIKPCPGYCLNVLRGCLASLSELDLPWRRHVALLRDLSHTVAGQHSLELALLGIRGHINEAILHAQLHGPRLTATVDKVCGQRTDVHHSTAEPLMSTSATSLAAMATPFSPIPDIETRANLANLRREFMSYITRYQSFFGALPEMLCEGETVVDDFTCWSGSDVVERYAERVVGNGVRAQRHNPEVKVRAADPALMEMKERLELFNQEIQERMPGLGHREPWVEAGSGTADSSGECDDEDGCQGSGDGKGDKEHADTSREVVTQAKAPEDTNPRRPSIVRVHGSSTSAAVRSSLPSPVLLLLFLLSGAGTRWTFL
ncbi:glypican-5 isoform X2 [Denticeps clupeoides]|uniref:Glypican-5-like n=1 Tax=Denticeps clupeoides TaxID=299321 RepID=A0AAY4AUN5_9TELE|nr:glypican-5-like isoform X2 [Denticeps clupeoides]